MRLPSNLPNAELAWRPLCESDLAEIAALEAAIHLSPWTVGNFRDALLAGYATRVVECEGRIVAYGVLMAVAGEAQILNLSVVREARREGLGRALLRRFIDDARRLSAEQIFLEVRASNIAAIGLYQTEGFVPIARRVAYYPGATVESPREDALVMRRALGEASLLAR